MEGEERANEIFERLKEMKPANIQPTCLAHADLAAPNIIFNGGRVVGIIDWEQSGWRPYWWEYRKALHCPQLKTSQEMNEWSCFVESFLDAYDEEVKADIEISGIEGFPY